MAGIYFVTQQAAIALTAATAKSVMEVIAAANTRVRVSRIEVTVYGAASGTANAKVEVNRVSNDGTWTSATVTKRNETDSETLQTTSKHTATVEPTTSTVLDVGYCSSIQGTATFLYTENNPMYVKGGSYLGVRVTSPATASCTIRIEGEE